MRILFLVDAVFEDLVGGSRAAARELARGLTRRGHQVTFLAGRQAAEAAGDEEREGVRIVRYAGAGSPAAFVREGRAACARLWAEGPYDIIHTHFAYAALGPLQAAPRRVPRIRTFHGPWDEEGWFEDMAHDPGMAGRLKACGKRHVRYRIERRDLRAATTVLTLSDCFRRLVMTRYGLAPERVVKIAGGADVERFRPPLDKGAVRRALGLPYDRRLLLSVRRLAPRMGLDNLVRGLPQVAACCPGVLLLIGGSGPERPRLEGLIRDLHLENHVRLLGFIPDDQLAAHYQAADAFVLPTIALEGFGLVTTEALACGTPVVGTPSGATPEILCDLEKRLVTRDASPPALAEAILAFLGGDWAQGLTPEVLHQFVRDRYTWGRHVEAVEAVYGRAINEAGRSTPAVSPRH